jgi:hypothetical protein
MEDKMYIFYLKSGKVAEVIGDNLVMDCDKVLVFKEKKIRASFMFDGIEGFITKNIENSTEVTEDDTRKE